LAPSLPAYVDLPPSGRHAYFVTALAKDGWESPGSHAVDIVTGRWARAPLLAVRQPVSILRRDEPVEIGAVACGDSPVAAVKAHYRFAPDAPWREERMRRRFRCAYHLGLEPEYGEEGGLMEYYIEAVGEDGLRSYWPGTAPDGGKCTATFI
jgi:hypothetical protein